MKFLMMRVRVVSLMMTVKLFMRSFKWNLGNSFSLDTVVSCMKYVKISDKRCVCVDSLKIYSSYWWNGKWEKNRGCRRNVRDHVPTDLTFFPKKYHSNGGKNNSEDSHKSLQSSNKSKWNLPAKKKKVYRICFKC